MLYSFQRLSYQVLELEFAVGVSLCLAYLMKTAFTFDFIACELHINIDVPNKLFFGLSDFRAL